MQNVQAKIGVGHFRYTFFRPTETFIYNYLTAFERTLPVCITFKQANQNTFPFAGVIVTLYKVWHRAAYRLLHRFFPNLVALTYDRPQTFRALHEYRVAVLHAHFGYTGYQVLPIKRKTGLPLIVTFYGQDISAYARMDKWQRAYAELFAEGDLFLVEGKHMQEKLVALGCPVEKTAVQRIAIHVDKYPFRLRQPKSKDEPVRLLFCGTFREKKGILYALEAAARAQRVYPGLQFYIIGDGELWPAVEQLIAEQQMQAYTHLLGFQSHSEMIAEMAKADLFIHPSVTAVDGDSEGGAPTTILEAQACGLPVLSTTHADIPNIVVPGESALLSRERDVDSLTANLLTILQQQERWPSFSRNGRSFVEQYHDVAQEAQRLEQRYLDLAARFSTVS